MLWGRGHQPRGWHGAVPSHHRLCRDEPSLSLPSGLSGFSPKLQGVLSSVQNMKELALAFPLRWRLCQLALNPFPQARQCESWGAALSNPGKGRQEPSQVTLKQRKGVLLITALRHLSGGNGSLKSKSVTLPGRWISQTVWAKGIKGCWWIGLGLQWMTIARKGFQVIGFLVPSPENYFIYGCNK